MSTSARPSPLRSATTGRGLCALRRKSSAVRIAVSVPSRAETPLPLNSRLTRSVKPSPLKSAVALTQQHRQVVREVIYGRQVSPAVPVEVAGGQGMRTGAHGERPGGSEGAGAAVEQDGDSVGPVLRRGEVEPAVAVQVGGDQG